MSDLHELSAVAQVAALRSREISSTDLTEHYLRRIEQLDGTLGAFITVSPELALDQAARADQQLAQGLTAPLLGLPIGIKDLHATGGMRTTFGSAALHDHVPAEDAWTVGLLRRAGTIVVGKTNVSEFGATCFTENAVTTTPAVTPFDSSRYSSGSSGGAASAVAAGLLPVGHASDGAGSTRTPASTCHLVGVKPSRGLVSPAPTSSFLSLGIEGPVARSVADAAVLLDVMAQPSPADLYGWRPEATFVQAIQGPVRRLRVGVWTDTGMPGTAPHPQAVLAVEHTAALLSEIGHDVREMPLPAPYDDQVRHALVNHFASSVSLAVRALVPVDRLQLLTTYTQGLLGRGARLTGHDVMLTHSTLARVASAFLTAFAPFDVVLTPTTNGPPVKLGGFAADTLEETADRMLSWSCYTPWVNLSGQPAVSLPLHLDSDGLPYGVQLVGRQRHDTELLALAAQLEQAAPWNHVRPPCWEQ
jgi:amidase